MRNNRPSRLLSLAVTALGAAGAMVMADFYAAPAARADESFRPMQDKVALKECSDCHIAFPPGLLPMRSWQALMAGLDNHFGENATLDEATAKHITAYLVANAADSGGGQKRVLRGLAEDAVPLRISDTPWWIRQHRGEVRPGAFEDPRVKSKSNCVACHSGAARGEFGDD